MVKNVALIMFRQITETWVDSSHFCLSITGIFQIKFGFLILFTNRKDFCVNFYKVSEDEKNDTKNAVKYGQDEHTDTHNEK